MTLSILIPAYNPGKWLRGILGSLVAQIDRYPDTEIIVVDDGSTEELRWVADFPHTRYIRTDNYGESHARNILWDEARGEYIQFIDSDDEIYPNALDVIYSNIRDGYDFVSYEFDTDHNTKRSAHKYGQLAINYTLWSYTFRKAIGKGERFNESMKVGCDVDWLDRVLSADMKHKHDDRVWYNYRFDGNDKSLCHQFLRGEIK